MKKTIRIGSRDSVLAVKQAQIVMNTVKETYPDIEFELITIKTSGDKIQNKNLETVGGKGLFIKELEQALIDGNIDIAVHSYKDMPYEETEGLSVVALSKREAPFDVLVLPKGIDRIDNSKPVGSSSRRRTIQFARLYDRLKIKGLEIKPVRGNVLTRLSKLDNGDYAALILAQAGLNRLDLQDRISRIFTIDEMIPSASQGILAVQGRQGGDYSYLENFHSRESEIVSKAERQFLKTLGGGCSSPVAVYGHLFNSELLLTGMYVDPYDHVEIGKINGSAEKPDLLGETLAEQLRAKAEQR